MKNKYAIFYIVSVVLILLMSIYPVFRGMETLMAYFKDGYIEAENYPKYIIPYAPICFSIIASVVFMPLFFKLYKKRTLLVVSIVAILMFFVFETGFEQIRVMVGYEKTNTIEGYTYKTVPVALESWQLGLCMVTPQVYETIAEPIYSETIGGPIYAENNPVYKVHFYIISIIIILAVLQVIHGFSKMIREENYDRKKPLLAQLISIAIFIGLCILACFTAFYRTGDINVSGISAILMSIFFITFGVTAGIYVGCIFYKKNKIFSTILPTIIAMLTTIAMYVGEMLLMGGELFKLGTGLLFRPLLNTPFAFADISVILFSGIITYIVMKKLNKEKKVEGKEI